MPNRIVTFAVLLFSFAVILFSFKPPEGTPVASINGQFHVPVVTLTVGYYYVFGAIAIAASLFFTVVACRRKWREHVEKFVDKPYLYYPGFVIFGSVYTITWLKSVASILSISPPHWVVYLVFYFGLALFLFISVLYFKGLLEIIRAHKTP